VLTVSQLTPPPATLEDLRGITVGVVRGSVALERARTEIANTVQYNTFEAGINALTSGQINLFLVR
jgi:ABC-type amino acid transport substrate-binding protein